MRLNHFITKFVRYFLCAALVAVIAATAAGCADPLPPEPEPKPTPVSPPATPAPSPTMPTPAPITTPVPEQEDGPLELGEFYFLFGYPDQMGLMFVEDGLLIMSDGEEAQYEMSGFAIRILVDGELGSELRIIDEFTIDEPSTGMIYIRAGGSGYGGLTDLPPGPRVFFAGEHYFLNGEATEKNIHFLDYGIAVLYDEEEMKLGEYTISDNEITVAVGDEVRFILKILNPVTLEDTLTGEIYGLEGILGTELTLDADYYQFGDPEEIYLRFSEGEEVEDEDDLEGEKDFDSTGEVLFGFMREEISAGTFTVRGQTLMIDIEGEETELFIVNIYILSVVGQDVQFIRMPNNE